MTFDGEKSIKNQYDVKKNEKKYQILSVELSSNTRSFRVSIGCHQHLHAGKCGRMLKRLKNVI